jgi:hypothetical protein
MNPLNDIAVTFAGVLGWNESPYTEEGHQERWWPGPKPADIVWMSKGLIQVKTETMWLAVQPKDETLTAELIYFRHDGRAVNLAPDDVSILRRLNDATDGTIAFAAINGGDPELLRWMGLAH